MPKTKKQEPEYKASITLKADLYIRIKGAESLEDALAKAQTMRAYDIAAGKYDADIEDIFDADVVVESVSGPGMKVVKE